MTDIFLTGFFIPDVLQLQPEGDNFFWGGVIQILCIQEGTNCTGICIWARRKIDISNGCR